MRRLKLDKTSLTKIALSHGHFDHYAAMTDLLIGLDLLPKDKKWDKPVNEDDIEEWLTGSRIPIIAHPAAFRERWKVNDDGTMVGPFLPPPHGEWQAAGAEIVLSEGPYQLAQGCWTTGYIPRNIFEESGRSDQLRYRKDSDFIPDDLEEDQAVVINIKGKGLVVLSGYAHSGIVNTIQYAREFSGVDTVYAVIGGFHLARSSGERLIRPLSI